MASPSNTHAELEERADLAVAGLTSLGGVGLGHPSSPPPPTSDGRLPPGRGCGATAAALEHADAFVREGECTLALFRERGGLRAATTLLKAHVHSSVSLLASAKRTALACAPATRLDLPTEASREPLDVSTLSLESVEAWEALHGELCQLHATLTLIHRATTSMNGDAAREFLNYGGHNLLMKVMDAVLEDWGLDDEPCEASSGAPLSPPNLSALNAKWLAINAAVDAIAGSARTSGLAFPTRSHCVLADDDVACRPLLRYAFSRGLSGAEWRVLIHPVNDGQESQFTVGYLMWSAAVILSRWIARHHRLFQGKSVHEVGAGLGLCGLVAAQAQVRAPVRPHAELAVPDSDPVLVEERAVASPLNVMSDFNPTVVQNLHYNIALNGMKGPKSMFLDWSQAPEQEGTGAGEGFTMTIPAENSTEEGDDGECSRSTVFVEPVDMVIGSDVICQTEDARMLVGALKALMKRDGVALFCLPVPANRFGTEALPRYLMEAGFDTHTIDIDDTTLTCDLEESAYFRWQIHVAMRRDESRGDVGADVDVDVEREQWRQGVLEAAERVKVKGD